MFAHLSDPKEEVGNEEKFNKSMTSLTVPTQIIWGENDEVWLHNSSEKNL